MIITVGVHTVVIVSSVLKMIRYNCVNNLHFLQIFYEGDYNL